MGDFFHVSVIDPHLNALRCAAVIKDHAANHTHQLVSCGNEVVDAFAKDVDEKMLRALTQRSIGVTHIGATKDARSSFGQSKQRDRDDEAHF
mmetsp:Transcript_4074/g.13410  ORF Transcript_4074/g.13410 Transcript_4074/m.13410 type:complete len:92 (-) Transcript_4074:579-854(-)